MDAEEFKNMLDEKYQRYSAAKRDLLIHYFKRGYLSVPALSNPNSLAYKLWARLIGAENITPEDTDKMMDLFQVDNRRTVTLRSSNNNDADYSLEYEVNWSVSRVYESERTYRIESLDDASRMSVHDEAWDDEYWYEDEYEVNEDRREYTITNAYLRDRDTDEYHHIDTNSGMSFGDLYDEAEALAESLTE